MNFSTFKSILVLASIVLCLLLSCQTVDNDNKNQTLPTNDDDLDQVDDDDVIDDDDDVIDDDDDDNDDDDTTLPSFRILSVEVEDYNTYKLAHPLFPGWTGDLWPNAWGADDKLYIANGDGFGFGRMFSDIVFNVVDGMPPNLVGSSPPHALGPFIAGKWGPESYKYSRKPTGMICVDEIIYLFYQNLANVLTDDPFGHAPHGSISVTPDGGKSWIWDPDAPPMFTNDKFTTGFFLDFGMCNQHAIDDYVYVYGLDFNWRYADDFLQTKLFLARVPSQSITQIETWEFFTGTKGEAPTWSFEIDDKAPVLEDDTEYIGGKSGIAQGSVVFIPQINRYLYSTRAQYEWIFYEAPAPWGPWTKITVKEWTGGWTETFHAGYPAVIPTKYLDNDGLGGWLISSLSNSYFDGAFYNMGLRRFDLQVEQVTVSALIRKL